MNIYNCAAKIVQQCAKFLALENGKNLIELKKSDVSQVQGCLTCFFRGNMKDSSRKRLRPKTAQVPRAEKEEITFHKAKNDDFVKLFEN